MINSNEKGLLRLWWVLYTLTNSSLIQKSSQRMNCGSMTSHYSQVSTRGSGGHYVVLSWNTGTLSPSLVRDWEQCRWKSKASQKQSTAPGCGHLVQPSAQTLQIHSHGPIQGCRVLPTPKLKKWFPTYNFQHQHNHLTLWPGTKTYRFPPTIEGFAKKSRKKKKLLLCMCWMYQSETFCLGRKI